MAPRSPNIQAFERNLGSAESWLAPFNGFGPDNFLVGWPEFSFEAYRGWLAERFPPNRFRQLQEKMDLPSLYAIGAFIQSLEQNPGIEQELTRLGTACHVYVGTGLGNLDTISGQAVRLAKAQRRWDRFWAERNPELTEYRARVPDERAAVWPDAPPPPETVATPRTAATPRTHGGTTGPAAVPTWAPICASSPRSSTSRWKGRSSPPS